MPKAEKKRRRSAEKSPVPGGSPAKENSLAGENGGQTLPVPWETVSFGETVPAPGETAPAPGETVPAAGERVLPSAKRGEESAPPPDNTPATDGEKAPATDGEKTPATDGEKTPVRRGKRFLGLSRRELLPAVLFLFSLCLFAAFHLFPAFAAGYNGTVGHFFRRTLAALTNFLPFSLAEILLMLLPLFLVLLGFYAARRRCGSWRETGRFLLSVCLAVSLFFSLFVFSFAAGYATPSLRERLSLPKTGVNAETLEKTARALAAELENLQYSVDFDESGASVMPYDTAEMNRLLLSGFSRVSEKYSFIRHFDSRVKPVLFSRLLSYTHITGVYSYYTGEANLNVFFPDMTLPYTAAHELSHQRGIAREDEANFVAFLVCAESGDAFIRYSGYLELFEYVIDALYEADPAAFRAVADALPDAVRGDIRAYNAFFSQFQDAGVAVISDKINSTYIKANGQAAGTASYSLCVTLAVAYFA